MRSESTVKIILLFIGTLILVQLIFFNIVRSRNMEIAERQSLQLKQEIQELTIDKQYFKERLAELEAQYGHIVSSVPRRILEGYEDQEKMLASFLDYIETLDVEGVESKVTFRGERKFTEKPVPVFKHDLMFDFTFKKLSDGEKFLSRVLGQDYYPLVVQSFDLHKTGQQTIVGKMSVTLHIPARIQSSLAKSNGKVM